MGPTLVADEQGEWIKQVSPNTAKVILDANGGTLSGTSVITQTSEVTDIDVPATSRPGYVLIDWNTKSDGSGTSYQPGDSLTPVLGSTIFLHARWVRESDLRLYTVVHRQESATEPGEYKVVGRETRRAFDSSVTVEPNHYYGFEDPAAQTVTLASDGSTVVTFDYPRTRFTVVLYGGGVAENQTQEFVGGVRQALLPAPVVEGKRFVGWMGDPAGVGGFYADRQPVAFDRGPVTLIASYLDEAVVAEPYGTSSLMHVSLKGGEEITIPNIPDGTPYEVREINVPDGWTMTGIVGGEGTITSNTTSEVTVTNEYSATGEFEVVAYKELVGGTLDAGDFEFELVDASDNVVERVANAEPDARERVWDEAADADVENPHYGQGIVRFSAIEVDEPGTFTYRIREVAGNDAGIDYDDHVETVTVNATDNFDGTISCTVSYDADGAVFSNEMIPGSLSVTKAVDGVTDASSDKRFSFTLSFADASGAPLADGTYAVSGVSQTELVVEGGSGELELAGGETAVVEGLPHGVEYTVTEADAAGWTMTESDGAHGVIAANATAQATFANRYYAEGDFSISGHKSFDGALAGDDFSFVLMDEDGEFVARAKNDASGNFSFGEIPIDAESVGTTRTYQVREEDGGRDDIVYDEHVETVSVTFSDDGEGHLSGIVTYDADGVQFENSMFVAFPLEMPGTGRAGVRLRDAIAALLAVSVGAIVVVERKVRLRG